MNYRIIYNALDLHTSDLEPCSTGVAPSKYTVAVCNNALGRFPTLYFRTGQGQYPIVFQLPCTLCRKSNIPKSFTPPFPAHFHATGVQNQRPISTFY